MNPRIGFIGLGQMGRWMAFNLVRAGYQVMVHDANEKAKTFFSNLGTVFGDSPAGLAGQVDWIFLCLPGTEAVQSAIFGEAGLIHGARRGQIIVDLGTTDYLATIEFERLLKEEGLLFVDAPVTGMEKRAQDATLTIMFGGEQQVFDEIKPVLEVMGDKVLFMGGPGAGQLTKLVNQLLFNINLAGLAEVLPLAVKLGLDPEKVGQVINSGTGRSFASEFFVPGILVDRFDRGYSLKNAYKDMVSAAGISARLKIPLPMVQAATTTYQMALTQGLGDLDKGGMIKVFEELLGVKFRKAGGRTAQSSAKNNTDQQEGANGL